MKILEYLIFVTSALAIFIALPLTTAAQDGFGGARNNGNIRDQIDAGYVPLPEAFAVEGLLAEHNFPVRKERCRTDFCVFTAMGHGLHQPSDTRSAYLFVEPISGLEPGDFKRAPQNLGVVIDRSGSMSGWKIAAVIEATHALIDQLDERDRLAIVAFDTEAELLLASTPVTDKRRLHDIVDRIAAGGTTNIHDAMKLGFEQVAGHTDSSTGSRLLVLTDERPNVGDTSKEGFLELTGAYARQGVALSILGVGLDLGTELAFSVSQLKGGSYHYLENPEQVERLFGADFESFVTPVAHDLVLRVKPGAGLRIAEVFGVPDDQVYRRTDGTVTLRAASVFYDRKRSGAVFRLEPTNATPDAALDAAAQVSWSYLLASKGESRAGRTDVSHRAVRQGSLAEFESPDHYRGYALVNFAELLKQSLILWHDNQRNAAFRLLHQARKALVLDAWIANDQELMAERKLADDLLTTMQAHLPCREESPCRRHYPG